MRYSLRDVRASFAGAKAAQERHDLMFRYFARPLSFPVAWIALNAGLTPNAVTVVSLVMNAVGLAMLASGDRGIMALGVGIMLVSLVLDAADGNMARTARHFSPIGEWLEGVGAYLIQAAFHVMGGVGAWLALLKGRPVARWPADPAHGALLIAAGAVAAGSITLTLLVAGKFANVFPGVERGRLVARAGGGVYGTLFTIGRNLSFASGLVLPLTLAGILTGEYQLVIFPFAALNSGMLAVVFIRCLSLARNV